MKVFFIFIIVLVICYLLFKLITFLCLIELKIKLNNKDINGFRETLGQNYYYKKMLNGFTRCKWEKKWIRIKANFDYEGKLVSKKLSLPWLFIIHS
jgi:hypothetical protein